MTVTILKIFSVLFCSFLFFFGCGRGTPLEKGEEALKKGDYAAASKYLKKAAQKETSSIPLLYNLGASLSRAGKGEEAIAIFREILRRDLSNPVAMEYLACELVKYGGREQLAEAHELFSELLVIENDKLKKARILSAIANVEIKLQRTDIALARLLLSRVLAPEYAPSLYNLARLLGDNLKLYPEAYDRMNSFIIHPNLDDGMLKQANSYLSEIRISKEAATLPQHQTTPGANKLLQKGYNNYNSGRYAEAASDFAKVLEIDSRSYDAAFYRASALNTLNKKQEARNAYGRAADIDPTKFEPVYWHGNLSYATGEIDEAIRIFTTIAIPKWPDSLETIQIVSYAYAQKGMYYEAAVYGELYLDTAKVKGVTPQKQHLQWLQALPKVKFQP